MTTNVGFRVNERMANDDPHHDKPTLLIWNQALASDSPVSRSLARHFNLEFFDPDDDNADHEHENDDDKWAIVSLREMKSHRPAEQRIHEHHAAQALQYIQQAVCIFDFNGKLIWSNAFYRNLPEDLRSRLDQKCMEVSGSFADDASAKTSNSATLAKRRKFEIETDDAKCYEMVCSVAVEPDGGAAPQQQIIGIVWDSSNEKQLQKKLDAIDAAGSELVRIESETVASLNTAERLALLEDNIIQYTRNLLHFDHFNIYLLEESTNRLLPVMVVGMPAEVSEYELYASSEGSGISGSVAATAQSFICADVTKDPRYLPGLEGAVSSLSVPLRLHDKVVGVFNIESQKKNAFSEDDRQFAEIFGRYVALALNILDLLVVERCATSGTVAVNVIGEVDRPLNDISAEAQKLRDQLVSNPAALQSLDRVLTLVDNVRSRVREVAHGPKSILGVQDELAKSELDPLFIDRHVLVADDEANIRNTIANVLAKRGAKVTIAENGSSAVRILNDALPDEFDLVLSDISMPDRNGYEVFAAARERHHKAPVILMTGFGYDPHHSIVRASQEGLQCVLFKPFQIDQLLEEVTKALAVGRTDFQS